VWAVECLSVRKHNSREKIFWILWAFIFRVDHYFAVPELDFIGRDRVGQLQPSKILRIAGLRTYEFHACNVNRSLPGVIGPNHNELSGTPFLDHWMSLIVLYGWATASTDNERRYKQPHNDFSPVRRYPRDQATDGHRSR
jgi:hypothetical protein